MYKISYTSLYFSIHINYFNKLRMPKNVFISYRQIIEYYRNLSLFQININHLTVPTKHYLPNPYYSVDENGRHSNIDLSLKNIRFIKSVDFYI